jgi:hypothetical protein
MRVEWWLVTLFQAHAAGRIDDAKLLSAVDAIAAYLDAVSDGMSREAHAFRAHYVEPIPGVDYGTGGYGEEFGQGPSSGK